VVIEHDVRAHEASEHPCQHGDRELGEIDPRVTLTIPRKVSFSASSGTP